MPTPFGWAPMQNVIPRANIWRRGGLAEDMATQIWRAGDFNTPESQRTAYTIGPRQCWAPILSVTMLGGDPDTDTWPRLDIAACQWQPRGLKAARPSTRRGTPPPHRLRLPYRCLIFSNSAIVVAVCPGCHCHQTGALKMDDRTRDATQFHSRLGATRAPIARPSSRRLKGPTTPRLLGLLGAKVVDGDALRNFLGELVKISSPPSGAAPTDIPDQPSRGARPAPERPTDQRDLRQ